MQRGPANAYSDDSDKTSPSQTLTESALGDPPLLHSMFRCDAHFAGRFRPDLSSEDSAKPSAGVCFPTHGTSYSLSTLFVQSWYVVGPGSHAHLTSHPMKGLECCCK